MATKATHEAIQTKSAWLSSQHPGGSQHRGSVMRTCYSACTGPTFWFLSGVCLGLLAGFSMDWIHLPAKSL
eukprot:4063338-Amphidinium_carterae.1